MKELYERMRKELSSDNNWETALWLTENTPSRISGQGDDKKAAEYLVEKMKSYGLDAHIDYFETYNSKPGTSELILLEPEKKEIRSLTCTHIESTPPEGLDLDLVYMGAGGYEDYDGVDVKGKAILVEVNYSPATPEKARIAAEMGATAMICMNWGHDDPEVICMRGLKSVWGNPTPENFDDIPKIVGISVTRKDGEYLKTLCEKNNSVKIHINVQCERFWNTVPQPTAILRGSEEPEKFLLVVGHLDAWYPGVTCNATGDGTILELSRVFSKFKDEIKRSIYFVNWNGHEIAEATGSTYFADKYFDDVSENCIGYIVIDSTGLKGATRYDVEVSRELATYAHDSVIKSTGQDVPGVFMRKVGDQSFFGIGVPSIMSRMCYTYEEIEANHGAMLGWWNHTTEDDMTKASKEVMQKDLEADLHIILGLVNGTILPYDFTVTCEDAKAKLKDIEKEVKDFDIDKIIEKVDVLSELVKRINILREKLEREDRITESCMTLNKCLLRISRELTNVLYTYSDKYNQDSYGNSILSKPIPLLQDAVRLQKLNKNDLEYKLLYTKALRNRNRVADAISNAIDYTVLTLKVLEK